MLNLGDFVWLDEDGDGVQDAGEPGIEGALVELFEADGVTPAVDSQGNPVDAQVTGADGLYNFTGLAPGDYVVKVTAPSGLVVTEGGADPDNDDNTDSNGIAVGESMAVSDPVTLSVGGEPAAGVDGDGTDGNLTVDFGFYEPAALGNYVWLDEDRDGMQDAGEPGIGNVVVELIDSTGAVVDTQVTDADGGYLFTDLAPGEYEVRVDETTLPDGFEQTTNPVNPGSDFGNQSQDGPLGGGYPVTLESGDENLTADFGYNVNPDDNPNEAALGDRVWIDADGDGVQDPGEPGVEGVLVNLIGPGPDGIFGQGSDPILATTTTDSTGFYMFTELDPGAYQTEVDPSNFDPGQPLEGYTQTGDPDYYGMVLPAGEGDNLTTAPVILGPGDVFLNADYGYQPPADADNSIGDTVWLDVNGDGVQDPSEDGIPGVTVGLIRDDNGNGVVDPGDEYIATTTTDENGEYLFEGLPDGSYIVVVTDTDNVLGELEQSGDPDGVLDGMSSVVDLGVGNNAPEQDLDQDFGYTPVGNDPDEGVIGDTVFLDTNNNGQPDDGEGIEGVVVKLIDENGNQIDTTTTDENGNYWFGGLDPTAEYTVMVDTTTLPPGLVNTVDPDGTTDSMSVVDLGEPGGDGVNDPDGTDNGINEGQDFGYVPDDNQPLGTIGDLVWEDTNADGVNDGPNGPDGLPGTDDDEPGFEGVTIDLYLDTNGNGEVDPGEPRIQSTETDANGGYLFENLPVDDNGNPVNYVVDVTDVNGVLAGYWHSLGAPNTNDNSQADPYAVQLSVGSPDDLTADFGYYVELAALGNRTWLDEDGDGIQDTTDVAGVRVELEITYPGGFVVTLATISDGDGFYEFANLLADEDYNGDGVGPEPTFEVSAETNPGGLLPAQVDAPAATDKDDSDDHNGVAAQPVQGLTDTAQQADPNDEGDIASYDFGYERVPTPTPTDTPTNTPTDTPTSTPTDTPTNTPTDTPTSTPTDTPTNTPTDTPTNTPTHTFTNTPTPTDTPTSTPTDTPAVCGLEVDVKCQILPDGELMDECVIPPPTTTECESKIKATTLLYTGPDLTNATVEFVGQSGATATYNNVDLVSGETLLDAQNGYTIDAAFSGATDLGPNMTVFINGVPEVIHTSCSTIYAIGQPAPLNNPKGAPSPNWFVISIEGKGGDSTSLGANVKYVYTVTNIGGVEATDVVVIDSVFGEVSGSPIASILPGDSVMLMETAFVFETTTNTVTVTGEPGMCEDDDDVTVIVEPLPTPTATNTPTNTPDFTDTPTPVDTATPTHTFTNTPTNTFTNTPVNTFTNTPVNTFTNTPTPTETPTPTFTPAPCDEISTIDFDHLDTGEIVDEQFAALGVHISTVNNGSGPNLGIVFDGSNPTGGDVDLGTANEDFGGPGIGVGGEAGQPGQNDVALGKLLIIAEDAVDADGDGLVDDPDDEAGGGVITFDFDQPTDVLSVQIVDIEETTQGSVIAYDDLDQVIANVPMQVLGDNSVQRLVINALDASRLEVVFAGSGAVSEVELCIPGVPSIDIRKQIEGPDTRVVPAGTDVDFEIAVTNTGQTTLFNVEVSDPQAPECDRVIGQLDPGETFVYTCTVPAGSIGGGAIKTYLDTFYPRQYSNNQGTANWAGPWIESDVGASQSPFDGNVVIGSNDKLWLDDYPDTSSVLPNGPSVRRSADLSGAESATLRFNYETHSGVDPDDIVVAEISSDGVTFDVLHQFIGAFTTEQAISFDISSYISSTTTIRFRVAQFYGASGETFKVDNLKITTEDPGVFVNEACVSGDDGTTTVSDCDESTVEPGVPSPTPTLTSPPDTHTPVPPTNTRTNTPVPPTNTRTNTPVPPTNTRTNTPVPPTSTRTNTPVPTSTNTPTPAETPLPCDEITVIDFDHLDTGEIVDEQFAGFGVHISTVNGGSGPDLGIVFDSANPTGGDTDLGTPNEDFGGPGIGAGGGAGQPGENDTALGKLLIIAEDAVDADGDGLIDDPDDEVGGGVITFDFDQPTDVLSVQIVDIDGNESGSVVAYDGSNQVIASVDVALLGTNSVQRVVVNAVGALRLEVITSSTGAISEVELCIPGVPSIDIRKQIEGPDTRVVPAGTDVDFEIAVTNTGQTTLFNVEVSDPQAPECDRVIGQLDPGETFVYTCTVPAGSIGGGAIKTYLDTFYPRQYSNNQGTANWAGPWIESDVGASQSPFDGNVVIGSNDKLWLDDYPDTSSVLPNGPSVRRSADLSGAESATLRFNYETHSGVDPDDIVVAEISSDGVTFDVLHQFIGAFTTEQAISFDISSYISSTTTIRFRVAQFYGASGETFKVDNLKITTEDPGVFVNEACVSGDDGTTTVSDCDESTVEPGVPSPTPTLTSPPDTHTPVPPDTPTRGATNTPTRTLVPTATRTSPPPTSTPTISPSPSPTHTPSTGSIGDYVWEDLDKDGVQDSGEPGIAGVKVRLKVDGVKVAETVTDSNGFYLFENVDPGTYLVRIVVSTLPAGLTTPTYDADGIAATPNRATVQLSAGENRRDVDFGYCASPTPTPTVAPTHTPTPKICTGGYDYSWWGELWEWQTTNRPSNSGYTVNGQGRHKGTLITDDCRFTLHLQRISNGSWVDYSSASSVWNSYYNDCEANIDVPDAPAGTYRWQVRANAGWSGYGGWDLDVWIPSCP